MPEPSPTTADLLRFIDASPSPYHCAAEVASRLEAAGFAALDEGAEWSSLAPGTQAYVARGGTVLAFRVGMRPAAEAGFRLLGAHTDSPNLRVKPVADKVTKGWRSVAVETYGGLLKYTWLDRDLGLSGRVSVRDGDGVTTRLLRVDRPILRVPSLAIHLNREIRTEGLKLNAQKHMPPVLGLTDPSGSEPDAGAFKDLVARTLDVEPDALLAWDLMLHDVVPCAVGGLNGELVFAPRLDNQGMCHAALAALLDARADAEPTQVLCLHDHEEVGSTSTTGAAGPMVEHLLRRLAEVDGPGATPGGFARAVASSWQCSADMAHAVHPNYADRHEPLHLPEINGGPVVKVNSQQRYASDAETSARFTAACQDVGVPVQTFVTRTDLACGTTIGPISAARLGIRTVDVGNAMLSMHSIRETTGAHDPERMVRAMARFLEV